MHFKYYDRELHVRRFKRRYIWSFWAYLAGLSSAFVVVAIVLH